MMLNTVNNGLCAFKVSILLSSTKAEVSNSTHPGVFVGTVVLKPATSSTGQDSAPLLIDSADSWLLSSAPACIAAALAAMHHWGRKQWQKVAQN